MTESDCRRGTTQRKVCARFLAASVWLVIAAGPAAAAGPAPEEDPSNPLWPLLLYALLALLVPLGMLGASYFLGERHREEGTTVPYESGISPTGSARGRFSAHFFLVAVFLVVFDVESLFIFAWACAARQLGWAGYFELAVFVVFLLAALVYLGREGALEPRAIHPTGREPRGNRESA